MVASSPDGVKHPVRAVLFDYGGVLHGDARDVWAAADAAGGLPPGTLWAAWHDIPEYRASREGRIDGALFRAAIVGTLARSTRSDDAAERALATLEAHLASLPAIDADMRALVHRLRAAGRLELGLLSNGNRGFTERLRERGVAGLFDDVVVSADVGLAKPDPAIFHLAARRLGVAPETCLMIDDQPQHVAGSRAAGVRAHLHEPARLPALERWLHEEGALP
jgi:putative hydrolase of the HAD superfamily